MANPIENPTSQTIPTLLNFPAPMHLKHKPMFLLPYEAFDGPYNPTDCKYLSVGLAQWDEPGALSAKCLRWTGDKWSRLSEELPLHRVVDLAILIAGTILTEEDNSTKAMTFPPGSFHGQNEPINLNRIERIPELFLDEAMPILKERFLTLRNLLNKTDLS